MRIVLDTNVLVSALMEPRGFPALVLLFALRGDFELCLSPAIIGEYEDVLRRPALKLNPAEVQATIERIRKAGLLFRPTRTLGISPDEPDNRFIECADAAEAEYLITGNKKHFPIAHGPTVVVTPREFLDTLTRPAKK